ncbi:hypothetical protein TSOC_006903 [Tetrabaena socialis]|uniref:AMMECR1 domain-containing protein n=1 Tax=Tetrabaena socialis TaxID=47790 RepID=A0A2J8A2C0_9CHLO|nr:hypothetical protein TSOC_006903 [Tetrabaena socialis]|eukprot:PNH06686.1 hypothetical protein TSOC_006903 [Tetrabaena socialis]
MLLKSQDGQQEPHIASREHAAFAFAVLHAHLAGTPPPEPNFGDSLCALFVTWNTRSGSHWKLRGCIGSLEPRQLHPALHDYALNSSLRDHRFSPIKLRELPSLQCKAAGWQDWDVGTHGIIIRLGGPEQRGVRRTATFLGGVAPEQGWDRAQAVGGGVRKAGYAGPITAAGGEAICLERYQSTVAGGAYEEYAAGLAAEEGGGGAGASGGEAVGAGGGARAISLQVAA